MRCVSQQAPIISKTSQGHDEIRYDALHWSAHWVFFSFFGIFDVGYEYYVVSLREAHDKDEIDDTKSQKIGCHHPDQLICYQLLIEKLTQ